MLLSPYPEESVIKQRSPAILNGHKSSLEISPEPAIGSTHKPLQARLALQFAEIDGTTRLVARDHFGPLVQKPLYPEGREVCHTVIIHPREALSEAISWRFPLISERLQARRLRHPVPRNGTKPMVILRIRKSHSMPVKVPRWNGCRKETIFYNHANVDIDHQVTLEDNALYVGCEILCFGRTASGETFNNGQIKQRTVSSAMAR